MRLKLHFCFCNDQSSVVIWFIQIEILTPKDYIGPLMELAQERRAEFKEMKFITEIRASLSYAMPLAEVAFSNFIGQFLKQFVFCFVALFALHFLLLVLLTFLKISFPQMVGDFFDQLKSRSKGYASMEYTFMGY